MFPAKEKQIPVSGLLPCVRIDTSNTAALPLHMRPVLDFSPKTSYQSLQEPTGTLRNTTAPGTIPFSTTYL